MGVKKVPFVKFNNGLQYPVIGLGTWLSKPGEVEAAVTYALAAGYRHIDCARVYKNEKEIGAALANNIKKGTIKREDLFITSKLWNTFHRRDLVKPAVQRSLKDLGLTYLDLYLIHWPQGYKEGGGFMPQEKGKTLYSETHFIDTWHELETCVKEGLLKSIGVANFNSQQIEKILGIQKIKPVVNQVECHPYLTQRKLQTFCNNKGILLTAYSPLGAPTRPWAKPGDPLLLDDPKLKKVAEKYSKSPAQILIRYQIQRGNMVIPKSVTKARIESNISVFDFQLSQDDMKYIDSFNRNGRLVPLSEDKDHKDYPFNIEF